MEFNVMLLGLEIVRQYRRLFTIRQQISEPQEFPISKYVTSGIPEILYEIFSVEILFTYSTNGGEEECLSDIGGKARRKEITGKTKT
jgi:hypothetical protein